MLHCDCILDIFFTQARDTDELAGFEESWKGNARHHLAGLNQNAGTSNNNEPGNEWFRFVITFMITFSFYDKT